MWSTAAQPRFVTGALAEADALPVVNLEAKLKMFSEHWTPKVVARFNGHDVIVVKLQEEFIWDLHIVSKGVEHRPVATEKVHLLLIEPEATPNTGDPATAASKEHI